MFRHRTFGAAFAVLAIAAVAPAQDNAQSFEGPWSVTAAKLGEDDAPELVGSGFLFEGEVAKFTQAGEDGKPVTDVHPMKTDPKSNRIVLYQQPNPEDPMADPKAGMQRGIYAFKDATLYLCLTAPDASEFPTKFVAKDEKGDYLLLRLERPRQASAAGGTVPRQ